MLHVVSKEDAIACVLRHTDPIQTKTESVPLLRAYGRTLACDLKAAEDVPAFDRTTVDGYAVRAADTFGAGAAIPAQLTVVGSVAMGEKPLFSLHAGECAAVSTGGMLPQGADAAVMVEHTDDEQGLCLVYRSAAPGENVTRRGDDIAAGSVALHKGTRIGAPEIGVLSALGVYEVPVFRKPLIAVISTGDELVQGRPEAGQVRDVNGYLLCTLIEREDGEPLFYGAVRDDRETIAAALQDCLEKADAVLISGGSSAGTRDMTVSILDELGSVYFHGIAMKPGKPTIFGTASGKPVFGLPGHPLAAYFVFRLIVAAYLRTTLQTSTDKPLRSAVLSTNVPSNHGREEYLCVHINAQNEAVPLHTKSGVISVLSRADGFIRIPRDTEGLEKGAYVEIYEL